VRSGKAGGGNWKDHVIVEGPEKSPGKRVKLKVEGGLGELEEGRKIKKYGKKTYKKWKQVNIR